MSDLAKLSPLGISDSIKVLKFPVDFKEVGLAIGVYQTNHKLPAFHDVVNVDFAVEEAGASGGDATVSFGIDEPTTEPDNFLADSEIANFATLTSTAGAKVAGIPRLGTAATAVSVGATDATLACEVKDAALTALKVTVIVTLIPTR